MKKMPSADIFEKVATVAHHYGFPLFDDVVKRYQVPARRVQAQLPASERKIDSLNGELARVLHMCHAHDALIKESPQRFYSTNVSNETHTPKRIVLGIHTVGVPHTIAEAITIGSAYTILSDIFKTPITVRVNSMGDRDSSARFLRELNAFFRKHMNEFTPNIHQTIKQDPLGAYDYLHAKEHPLAQDLPMPMGCLGHASRTRFEEVLEHLEAGDIPYEIDHRLIGNRDCYTDTLFAITHAAGEEGDGETLPLTARGGRYDEFSRRLFRHPLPAVSAVFTIPHTGRKKPVPPAIRQRQPKICFVHIGFEAGLNSLKVLNEIRHARIPFHHALGRGGFSDHLAHAESLSIPYLVLMGQKEAMTNSVIVRNIASRAQENVPLDALVPYLKTLR